jgi:hypothetical protein
MLAVIGQSAGAANEGRRDREMRAARGADRGAAGAAAEAGVVLRQAGEMAAAKPTIARSDPATGREYQTASRAMWLSSWADRSARRAMPRSSAG